MLRIEQPVIFLPGTLCDERIWMPCWRHLDLDQRSYVPLQWAEDLQQMLSLTFDRINNYDVPVHLVGFSMGGYVAALAALDALNIASLTMIGYSPSGLTKEEEQQRLMIIKSINNQSYQAMSKARLADFVSPQELTNKTISETMLAMGEDLGGPTLRAQFQATTPRKDLSNRLQKCSFPIHFITAEHDQIASADEIEKIAAELPNASFTRLDNTAHMMLLSEPEKMAHEIHRFICHRQPEL